MPQHSEHIVEHLFRTEYGKLVAMLTRFFGPGELQLAEDIVQETLIAALTGWGTSGIPDNPTGWLVQVAKRKAINEVNRNKMRQKHHAADHFTQAEKPEIGPIFLEEEIEDNQLRMIFTCCHASLDVKSQIALTLKTLCGFGVKEVANALLSTESTINKRLYRARKSIRESNVPFTIPQGNALEPRLEAVSLTLYLWFNEGYNSSSGDSVIQKELCLEAIRLTKLLVDHFPKHPKLSALLSLMCFHTARFDARIDDHGAIIVFEDQDRSRWNLELIHIGMHHLKNSLHDAALSAYHIEANIAAEHCLAGSFETTNWQHIYDQYLLLHSLKPNPVILLNLAIIQSKLAGIETSLKMLAELAENDALKRYHLLPATQGIFRLKLGQKAQAAIHLKVALELSPSPAERSFLLRKLTECES